jgi:chromosome segregation ATPase
VRALESQHAAALTRSESEWSARLDQATSELRAAMKRLEDKHEDDLFEKGRAWDREKSALMQTLAQKDVDLSALQVALESASHSPQIPQDPQALKELEEQVYGLRGELKEKQGRYEALLGQLSSAEQTIQTLRESLERAESSYSKLDEDLIRVKDELELSESDLKTARQELAAARAAKAADTSLSQEEVNALMQDIYLNLQAMFAPRNDSDDEEGNASKESSYTSQDVLKRCRKVLKQVFDQSFYLALSK